MDNLLNVFRNNRSRVAIVLSPVLYALVFGVTRNVLNLDEETSRNAANFVAGAIIAYILGNGYYETQTAVLDKIPAPPKK